MSGARWPVSWARATGGWATRLGMQLTEGLSLRDGDATLLVPGIVITLEPVIATAPGRIMVHEEVIAITDGAPRALSPLAGPDLPVIG